MYRARSRDEAQQVRRSSALSGRQNFLGRAGAGGRLNDCIRACQAQLRLAQFDPLLSVMVFCSNDRSTSGLDLRPCRGESWPGPERSFARAGGRSRPTRSRTAGSDGHELAMPTQCCPSWFPARTTGLPRNLTFAHAAEKVILPRYAGRPVCLVAPGFLTCGCRSADGVRLPGRPAA